ncbi:hypothetical protein J6590_031975 [Homalodisca vitripennis]|nr:hypothetical protein J6590_031975 [Homalodisca vitripennis]
MNYVLSNCAVKRFWIILNGLYPVNVDSSLPLIASCPHMTGKQADQLMFVETKQGRVRNASKEDIQSRIVVGNYMVETIVRENANRNNNLVVSR